MQVLGIGSSLRTDSNSEYFVKYTLEKLSQEKIEVEYVSLHGKTILPCRGCYGCKVELKCTLAGDDFTEIYDKMQEADGIIVGSPVYYSSATPQLMAMLSRAGFCSRWSGKFFSRKVGAPITVARRAGHSFAFAQLLLWFFINDMIVPGSVYWNVGLAGAGGARDASDDTEGKQILDHFAKNMAWVLQKTCG